MCMDLLGGRYKDLEPEMQCMVVPMEKSKRKGLKFAQRSAKKSGFLLAPIAEGVGDGGE